MTNDQIANFLSQKSSGTSVVRINFKTRTAICGLFIKTNDYSELRDKNFWRIVGENKISEYRKTKDESLAKIFHGAEITKLTVQLQSIA